jgi:hypothetical protein
LKRLEDEADRGAPEARAIVLGHRTEIGARNVHGPEARRVQPGEQAEQGCFSAAGRA